MSPYQIAVTAFTIGFLIAWFIQSIRLRKFASFIDANCNDIKDIMTTVKAYKRPRKERPTEGKDFDWMGPDRKFKSKNTSFPGNSK